MVTKFGKLVTSEIFPKLFLVFYIVCICLAAYTTGQALNTLTGRGLFNVGIYLLYALLAVLIMGQKDIGAKLQSKQFDLFMGYLSSFAIYDFLYLVVWEIIAFLFPIRIMARANGVFVCMGAAVATVFLGHQYTKHIKKVSYDITLEQKNRQVADQKQPKPYHMVLISDLHMGVYVGPQHVRRVVEAVNSLSPDMIVISGDIFDVGNKILKDEQVLQELAMIFREFKAKDGVYAVLGNHDPNVADQRMRDFMQSAGVTLLHNETVRLEQFNLMGRTDDANNIRKPMSRMIKQVDFTKPLIVLDHDPQGMREEANYDVDLVLSGHTHAGQFFPVTLFTRWANGKDYFYGYEKFGKMQGVITSGAGFFQLPVRIGTSNEVVDLRLQFS